MRKGFGGGRGAVLGGVVALASVGCGDEPLPEAGPPATAVEASLPPPDLGAWTGQEPPPLVAEAPPPELSDLGLTFYASQPCGPFEETVFDLLLPTSVEGAPLVLFFHGGGFVGGTRDQLYDLFLDETRALLGAGFAVATAEYRSMLALGEGVRTSLQDMQVCLQYIRHHAGALGIDGSRIVLTGLSAGAGASLWIATHDDLADIDGDHAILATSTRVRGVMIHRPQATYDVLRWTEVFSPEHRTQVEDLFTSGSYDFQLAVFYGAPDAETVVTDPRVRAYRAAVDMLAQLSPDDPPIWAHGSGSSEAPTSTDALFHHPFHVRAIVEAAALVGVDAAADLPHAPAAEADLDFALRVTAP